MSRRAPISLDDEARTITATIATAAPVQRSGWRPDGSVGAWKEVLDTGSADLKRLNAGAAVLLDHTPLTDWQVGVTERAWIERGELRAAIRFGTSPRAQQAFEGVRDGILRGISVGYAVSAWQRDGADKGDVPTFRATAFEILEVSIVPVPADPSAGVRAAGDEPLQRTIPLKEFSMSTTLPAEAPASTTAPDAAVATRAAEQRHVEIETLLRTVGNLLPDADRTALRSEAHAENLTVDDVRTRAFARMVAAAPVISNVHRGSDQTFSNPDFLRNAMVDALAARAGVGTPSGPAREMMSLRMSDMAAQLLEVRGVNTRGMTPSQVLSRAMSGHSTSDFTNLLQSTGNRVLLNAFEPAASGLRRIMRMRGAADFRTLSTIRAAGVDRLREVAEGGAVQLGTAFEAAETYRVKTFARGFVMTRQAIINDDLGAFDSMRLIGSAAAATEAEEFYTLFSSASFAGPTMSDSVALYATGHGNLAGSGAALDVTTLSTGRAGMRAQRDLNNVLISVTPRYILCGPSTETAAEQVVATITAASASNVNPFSGRLEVVVEPRLTTNAWYLFAEPTQQPVFEMATLDATGGVPQIEAFTEAGSLGVTLRAVHDFGVGVVGWVGTWRNPGA